MPLDDKTTVYMTVPELVAFFARSKQLDDSAGVPPLPSNFEVISRRSRHSSRRKNKRQKRSEAAIAKATVMEEKADALVGETEDAHANENAIVSNNGEHDNKRGDDHDDGDDEEEDGIQDEDENASQMSEGEAIASIDAVEVEDVTPDSKFSSEGVVALLHHYQTLVWKSVMRAQRWNARLIEVVRGAKAKSVLRLKPVVKLLNEFNGLGIRIKLDSREWITDALKKIGIVQSSNLLISLRGLPLRSPKAGPRIQIQGVSKR